MDILVSRNLSVESSLSLAKTRPILSFLRPKLPLKLVAHGREFWNILAGVIRCLFIFPFNFEILKCPLIIREKFR
jgi:hypothetical protein